MDTLATIRERLNDLVQEAIDNEMTNAEERIQTEISRVVETETDEILEEL